MNKVLFAALASVVLLGASCSVQDFSTVVMDKPTIAADIDLHSYAYGMPNVNGVMQLENGDVITALRIGNPQSEYFSTDWSNVFALGDGSHLFQFVCPLNTNAFYNRVVMADDHNDVFSSYLLKPAFADLVTYNGTLVFGGGSNFVTGVDTNRDITLYFNRPLTVSGITRTIPLDYFASTVAYRDYTDGYKAGEKAYEIVKDLERFEFNYYTGSGDDEQRRTITKTGYEAVSYITSYINNGLVSFRGLVVDLTSSVSDAHDIVARFHYSVAKDINAAPLYIDYEALTSPVAQEFKTHLAVSRQVVQVPWYVFNADLDVTYQGRLSGYGGGLLSERWSGYADISISYPTPDVGGRLNYIGILSGYAQGYADGVTSRDGEVADLTARVLSLEEDLEQYQGKDYQQIYNLGFQAGLDENAQGAATFNSLFGNILTAPLTILNGLTDISFFGMPILTAILSLLMVALALFLFKRFK